MVGKLLAQGHSVVVVGLECRLGLPRSKPCFLNEATLRGGEGRWEDRAGDSRDEEEEKDVKKKRSTKKDKLVFQSGRGGRRGTNSKSKAAAEKEEERKARHGRTGAETKAQRDRQRQVEKISET